MLAGLVVPEQPIGNMYFAAWSHSVIANAVQLSNDLKMGEYLKMPPRVMFLTQVYGTVLGGFVSYAVMISIVNNNRQLLIDSDGNTSWSGATIQSYNTNATSWALSKYLYRIGAKYEMVPMGAAHWRRPRCYPPHHYTSRYPLPGFDNVADDTSLFPRSGASVFTISTFLSLSNTPATSRTTPRKHASSSAKSLAVSSPSSICGISTPSSLKTTRISSRVLSTAPA